MTEPLTESWTSHMLRQVLVQTHKIGHHVADLKATLSENLTAVRTALDGVNARVTATNQQITDLQAKVDALQTQIGGQLNPDDQAAFDQLVADINAIDVSPPPPAPPVPPTP